MISECRPIHHALLQNEYCRERLHPCQQTCCASTSMTLVSSPMTVPILTAAATEYRAVGKPGRMSSSLRISNRAASANSLTRDPPSRTPNLVNEIGEPQHNGRPIKQRRFPLLRRHAAHCGGAPAAGTVASFQTDLSGGYSHKVQPPGDEYRNDAALRNAKTIAPYPQRRLLLNQSPRRIEPAPAIIICRKCLAV